MKVTREQFKRFRPMEGRVVVEVPYLTSELIRFSSGIELFTHCKGDDAVSMVSVRSGVVWDFSEDTDIPELNYDFNTPLQIKKGDKVWWTKNAIAQIIEMRDINFFEVEGRFFIVIPYKELVMKLEGGEYVGLNDNVITELFKPEEKIIDTGEDYRFHSVIATPLAGVSYKVIGRSQKEYPIPVNVGDKVVTWRPTKNKMEEDGNRYCFKSKLLMCRLTD